MDRWSVDFFFNFVFIIFRQIIWVLKLSESQSRYYTDPNIIGKALASRASG